MASIGRKDDGSLVAHEGALPLDAYDVNIWYSTLRDGSVSIAPAMDDEGNEKLGYTDFRRGHHRHKRRIPRH